MTEESVKWDLVDTMYEVQSNLLSVAKHQRHATLMMQYILANVIALQRMFFFHLVSSNYNQYLF